MLAKLKEIRKSQNFSQSDISKMVGTSLKTYQRIERGEVIPKLNTANKIAKALGKTVEELFE